jgi:hypothetical protein
MYAVSKSCIKVNNELTDYFPTLLGVKQGDNLSPNLFMGYCSACFIENQNFGFTYIEA